MRNERTAIYVSEKALKQIQYWLKCEREKHALKPEQIEGWKLLKDCQEQTADFVMMEIASQIKDLPF